MQDEIIAKLKARYPEKFTEENAINRNLDEERQALGLDELTEAEKLASLVTGADIPIPFCRFCNKTSKESGESLRYVPELATLSHDEFEHESCYNTHTKHK